MEIGPSLKAGPAAIWRLSVPPMERLMGLRVAGGLTERRGEPSGLKEW